MSHTYLEIRNQPVSWKRTIEKSSQAWSQFYSELEIRSNTQFLFIGCGTSYYLSQTAAALFQELTGYVSRAVPASEVFLAADSIIPKNIPTVAFAISRSGTTSEVLMAVEFLQKYHPEIQLVGITCHDEGGLSDLIPLTLVLNHAAEKSVVMTQSFTNMILSLQVFASKLANREDMLSELSRLPDTLAAELSVLEDMGRYLGQRMTRKHYVYLGLGEYYGLANEANLKLKEMTQVICEAYNPLEFRHGPISTVTQETCVVLLQGLKGESFLRNLITDVTKYGALAAVLQPEAIKDDELDQSSCIRVVLKGDFSDWTRTVLYMPALQFLAYYRAIALGLNPDEPRHLTQVVVLPKNKV